MNQRTRTPGVTRETARYRLQVEGLFTLQGTQGVITRAR